MVLKGKEKILICDFRRIGDGIMALPMFEALKKRYPECKTAFICENIADGIGENNPYIDEVFLFNKNSVLDTLKLIFKIRSKKYDVAIDALGMPKTAIMCWFSGAKIRVGIHKKRAKFYTDLYVGEFERGYSANHKMHVLKLLDAFPKERKPIPFFNVTEDEKEVMRERLKEFGLEEKQFFTASPSSKLEDTLWPVRRWAEVFDWMRETYNKPIVLQYAPSEKSFVEKIIEISKYRDHLIFGLEFQRIRDVITLLSLSKFHLAQNNGSKHLANGVKTPGLTLWGFESTISNWQNLDESVEDNIIWAEDLKEKKEYATSTEPIEVELVKAKIEEILLTL